MKNIQISYILILNILYCTFEQTRIFSKKKNIKSNTTNTPWLHIDYGTLFTMQQNMKYENIIKYEIYLKMFFIEEIAEPISKQKDDQIEDQSEKSRQAEN